MGKRSGFHPIRRYPKNTGGGGISFDMGKTRPAPFVIVTWLGVRTSWLEKICFWR